jgi:RNA polymerase sigma factor (sigma-70 family)
MDELALAGHDAPPSLDDATTDLVLRTVATHADALLATARRHSLCADDAHDAYQRALEIFLRRAASLDPATAERWLHVVVKHEAMALRRERMALVAHDELDLERHDASPDPSPEDQVLSAERVGRTAEALRRLKPQELRAMWLKALGNSYEEICEQTGWTYTKVNRCLAEGRKTFLERYAGIESGEECVRWQGTLSAMVDGEARPEQLADIRPHLRNCRACRATLRELHESGPRLAAVLPAGGLLLAPTGDHLGGGGPGFIARVLDTAGSFFHERATSSALKIQAFVDATGAGKVAAVAASAAAVAGGSAAVVRETTPDRAAAARPHAALSTPAGTARTASAAAASPAPTPTAITAARPTAAKAPTHAAAARRRRPRRGAARVAAEPRPTTAPAAAIEFAPEPIAPVPPSPSPSPKQPARPMNGGEFDP